MSDPFSVNARIANAAATRAAAAKLDAKPAAAKNDGAAEAKPLLHLPLRAATQST